MLMFEEVQLLRRKEVALRLAVSDRTVRRIPESELPVVRPRRNAPRYRLEDVERFIAKNTKG